MSPPVARRQTESELTLSGVLQLSTGREAASHLPLTEALQLSMQVIRLVAQTHDRGQVVGVLDAAHLVCSRSGNLAVGGQGGNPIAPELKRGEMPDRLTDVYALGALMYRLLTGRRVDPARIVEPPSHFNPAVDSTLDQLVLSALDEDPSERPYSAREMEQRLLAVYEELGLEDTAAEATKLIASVKPAPKPKPKAVARPTPKPAATIDWDDDDEALEPAPQRDTPAKHWLMLGGAAVALLLIAVLAWPSAKKDTRSADVDDAPAKVTERPTPSISPVQAKLVEPAGEGASASAPVKKKAESPKKSTRRARR